MKKLGSFQLNAASLQYVLIAAIILCITGIVGIFIMAQSILVEKAISTDHAKIDAELSQDEIIRLQRLRSSLKDEKATIDKTAKIVAESQQYTYQDQVINDITAFAAQTGVKITGFDFSKKPTATTDKSLPQKTIVTVTTDKSIDYTALLRFIKLIERNITKMQLTGLSIRPDMQNPAVVLGPIIELEVYLR